MPSHKFKYLSDIENGLYVMSIRRFGKAVQFQLSQATNFSQFFFLKSLISVSTLCLKKKQKQKQKQILQMQIQIKAAKTCGLICMLFLHDCFVSTSHCQVMQSPGVIKLTIDKIKKKKSGKQFQFPSGFGKRNLDNLWYLVPVTF